MNIVTQRSADKVNVLSINEVFSDNMSYYKITILRVTAMQF